MLLRRFAAIVLELSLVALLDGVKELLTAVSKPPCLRRLGCREGVFRGRLECVRCTLIGVESTRLLQGHDPLRKKSCKLLRHSFVVKFPAINTRTHLLFVASVFVHTGYNREVKQHRHVITLCTHLSTPAHRLPHPLAVTLTYEEMVVLETSATIRMMPRSVAFQTSSCRVTSESRR